MSQGWAISQKLRNVITITCHYHHTNYFQGYAYMYISFLNELKAKIYSAHFIILFRLWHSVFGTLAAIYWKTYLKKYIKYINKLTVIQLQLIYSSSVWLCHMSLQSDFFHYYNIVYLYKLLSKFQNQFPNTESIRCKCPENCNK